MIVEGEILNLENIKIAFKNAKKRLMIFDYDGTLVDFSERVDYTIPSEELFSLLKKFSDRAGCEIILSSGRDKNYIEKWFSDKNIFLFAEHGALFKTPDGKYWENILKDDRRWFDDIKKIMQKYTLMTKGSFLEVKEFSFSWHYRNIEPELAGKYFLELRKDILYALKDFPDIGLMEGLFVLEVKNKKINKGIGLKHFLKDREYDFILCAGDDKTDEYMFEVLPERSFTVKVREGDTFARYRVKSFLELNNLLKELAELF